MDSVEPAVLFRRKYGSGNFIFASITPEVFGNTPAAGKTCRLISALLSSGGVKLKNASEAYVRRNQENELHLNLSNGDWEFAIDPSNKGLEEKWQTGKNGSAKWISGLIADGIEVGVGVPFELFLRREYDGYAWYRLNFNLKNEVSDSSKLFFSVGAIDDLDEVYINGVKIGETDRKTPSYWSAPRCYSIPSGTLKKGRNLVAVRVFDEKGKGGIVKLPVMISSRQISGNSSAWITPYPEGSKRDYNYPADLIRGY